MYISNRFDNDKPMAQVSVGTSAVQIMTGRSARCTGVTLTNNHASQIVYVGNTNAVAATFYLYNILPGQTLEIPCGYKVPLWAIADGASTPLNTRERL